MLEEVEASLTAASRNAGLEVGDGSGVVDDCFPFPLIVPPGVAVVSREIVNAFVFGDSPGFPEEDFRGTIFLRVEGEAEAVDRREVFEGDFCAGLGRSFAVSGSGGTGFFGFVGVFVLVTEAVDVRLGLVGVAKVDVAVAVVLTLTVETVDETELRRGRGSDNPGNSDLVLLNVDDASLR